MFYEREIEIPFDVLNIDGFAYLVPHGLPVKVEPLIEAGIEKVSLLNRNVTVKPVDSSIKCETLECHPLLPTEEYLSIVGAEKIITRYSVALLDLLDMTIEALYDFYSLHDKRLVDLDSSLLTISKGRLCIGDRPEEQMVIVWTGADFVVAPLSLKLSRNETAVEEIEGAITGNRFRCKYGMLDIKGK